MKRRLLLVMIGGLFAIGGRAQSASLLYDALSLAQSLKLDSAQKEYLETQLLATADNNGKMTNAESWNLQVDALLGTLTAKQLSSFFYLKNGVEAGRRMRTAWKELKDAGVAEQLDSATDCAKACLYYHAQLKIEDIYKYKGRQKRQQMGELKKYRPAMVRMAETLGKRNNPRHDHENKEKKSEFEW